MTSISSVFKSALTQKYSSIQDTSVDYGNTNITANYSVEDIDLSLTSSTRDNTSIFDTNIADLTSSKESFVKLQDLSTKELENIDSIMNQAADLINRYEGLSFQSKGGYGTTMQAAQGELNQVKVDLDNFIKANSTYSSYQELLDTQKQIGDIDKYCEEMIVYYDRQIKWQDYYKIYDSEECQKSSIEGMLGEKEYTYNNYTSRSEEYTKLLEIQTIGNYDEKLKELFGDDYQEQFASYGLDFQFDYLKMYNYLYQTQGEEAAKEFYAFAEDNINSMDGLVHALAAVKDLEIDEIMDVTSNYLKVHAQGMGSGVVGSIEGALAWFSDNRSRSATSYETMWYSMMLETGKYGKGQVFNYQVGQGTGQMLPVMLIGCVCPESLMIGGMPVVKVATSGYLLMSSGGRDYKEQMINGKTREEAILHGLLSGTTEVTTEHLLGGLPFLSDSNVHNLRTFFTAMGKEGTQEVIQDMISEFLLGDGIPNFSSEAERDAYWDQWAKEKLMTFAVAAFSAGELQGGNLAMSKINLRNINTQIDKGIVTEQELVDLIKEQYPTETMDLSNKEIIGEYNGQIAKYIELKLEALLKMSPETSTDNTPIEEKVDTNQIESSEEKNSNNIVDISISSELDVLDLNKFEKVIKNIQEITIDKLPDGYTSVEQYKKDFTNQLLLKHGILMNNIHTYCLARDPIMFHELLENSEKIEELFIKNYQSDSLNTIYKKAQSSDIVSLWNKPKMVELIKSVTAKDFGIIMSNLNDSVGGDFNTLDVFVNKICSLNYEQLQELSKNYKYGNDKVLFGEKQFKLNMNNTMRVYDYLLNNIYTYNNRIYVPMDSIKGTIIPYYSSYNMDETFSTKLNSILEKKKSLENILIEEMKSSISKEVEIKDGCFITPKDKKYWNITYVMNGKEYTVTKKAFNRKIGFISSYDGFYNLEIGKALSNNQLFIKNIEENIRNNSLVLDKSAGIQEGINYITIEEDGVERRIIEKISSFSPSIDLNYEVSEQAKQINIKEVISLGDQDIQLSNYTLDDIYKVSYKIGEELATFYITPTRNNFRNNVNLHINDFIIKHNLFGAKDFKIEKVSDLETTIDYIHQLSGTSLLLQQDQYGGNQGDVPNFINNYYKKSNNAIENQKAKTMIDIIKSYYPNATQMDIINIAETYAQCGCLYMAFANTFVAHMGSIENGADIFKRKIGYDLIVTDGTNKSYNVEALALNNYLYCCKKMNLSMEETIKQYKGGPNYSSISTDIVSFYEDRGIKIKEQRGIMFDPKENSMMPSLLAEIASNPNNMYIMCAKGFDLESVSQSTFDNYDKALESSVVDKNVRKNIGGHGMLITGLTESGDLMVSSWKKKFIFKVGEMLKNDGYAFINSVRYEE